MPGLEKYSAPALLEVARGKKGDRSAWDGDIPTTPIGWGSWNRPLLALACEAFDALAKGDRKRLNAVLDLVLAYLRENPFMAGEQFSVVYSPGWTAHALWSLAIAAGEAGRADVLEELRAWLRAFVAYLALAAGTGAGRRIRDHNADDQGKVRPILGDGKFAGAYPFVAWAGKRGWSRTLESGRREFSHLDSPARGLVLAIAARLEIGGGSRKLAEWEFDMYEALEARRKRLPSLAALGPWLLDAEQASTIRAFLRDPLDGRLADELARWTANHRPKYPTAILRTEKGVAMVCLEAGRGSTATLYAASWEVGGLCRFLGAETGQRSSTNDSPPLNVEAGRAWIDEARRTISCERVDRLFGTISIPFPPGAVVWLFHTGAGEHSLELVGGARPPSPTPEPPAPGPSPTPAPPPAPSPAPGPRRRGKGGCSLLVFLGLLAAVLAACGAF